MKSFFGCNKKLDIMLPSIAKENCNYIATNNLCNMCYSQDKTILSNHNYNDYVKFLFKWNALNNNRKKNKEVIKK